MYPAEGIILNLSCLVIKEQGLNMRWDPLPALFRDHDVRRRVEDSWLVYVVYVLIPLEGQRMSG
jgi:hypothetical protein